MYYTQEKLALQTLDRICTLAKPAFGLWIRLSSCAWSGEKPRYTQVVLNLLTPLTSGGGCRLFIFKNTDILCLGIDMSLTLINTILGQIQTLLGDNIGQVFTLPADKKVLLGRLFPQQMPALWEGQVVPNESFLARQAIVHLQGGQLNFKFFLGLNTAKAQQEPYPLWGAQLKNVALDLDGYWGTLADINERDKDFGGVVLGVDIHAALCEEENYRDFRKCYARHQTALWGITPGEADYFDLTDVPFDYLFWPVGKPCPCSDKDKVICSYVQTQEQFAQALTEQYRYFTGPFVQILTTMQYKKTCPFGQDCTLPVCTGALLNVGKDKKCICPDHLMKRNLYALA